MDTGERVEERLEVDKHLQAYRMAVLRCIKEHFDVAAFEGELSTAIEGAFSETQITKVGGDKVDDNMTRVHVLQKVLLNKGIQSLLPSAIDNSHFKNLEKNYFQALFELEPEALEQLHPPRPEFAEAVAFSKLRNFVNDSKWDTMGKTAGSIFGRGGKLPTGVGQIRDKMNECDDPFDHEKVVASLSSLEDVVAARDKKRFKGSRAPATAHLYEDIAKHSKDGSVKGIWDDVCADETIRAEFPHFEDFPEKGASASASPDHI